MEKIKLYEYCIQSYDSLANCANLPVMQPLWITVLTGFMFAMVGLYFGSRAIKDFWKK